MSDNVPMTPEARWRHLKENGPKLLINLQSNDIISEKPKWLDEERFAKAKATIEKFYIGVSYSSFTGLLLILQLPDGLEPLLSTGNSKDIPSLYKRYLGTIVHVNSWYEDDVFDPETKGYKSIRTVRAMHKRLQQKMNDTFKVHDMNGAERTWFNQYDVAMTQFAFIGLAMLFPKKSAMIAATNEDLEHINYYWRVLGYLMGIEDEYNCCQFDKYEDIHEFMRLIFQHEYKDNFKKAPCEKGLEMTKAICTALHYFTPLITFNSLATWWSDCFMFNGYEPQPLQGKEKVLDCWTRLSFNHLLKYEGFLRFSNKLHKKRFAARLNNKDKVYEKLKVQYKDGVTFYSDRLDYFGESTEKDAALKQDEIKSVSTPVETEPNDKKECNNNNTDEQVYTKNNINACPFGYGAIPEAIKA